jgi:hypothetical protein
MAFEVSWTCWIQRAVAVLVAARDDFRFLVRVRFANEFLRLTGEQ